MGGFFGVASNSECISDLFYGTDYHSHLGTMRGGLATLNGNEIIHTIHDITNSQFKSKFESDIDKLKGGVGFRLRVGKYRIIYARHDKILMIEVVKIRPRGDVYK